MKRLCLFLPLALVGCASDHSEPPATGLANPAAVWCLEQGGTRVPVQSPQGVRTECRLSDGQTIDEWELWRRDHPSTH
ncbi:DUF333 domain-containing protein [Superficieibacter electus]|uniref:DUF333 domain-containing protein n=1 Tax=Superficieibacter electus TaxID=2022662 RepID=A0A2P5GVJ8_9ENTR|nr:DUF333 domain-containing protein [Superficieibacter electus]POP42383.1 DUF333 domain-containing protein [Superficieibacter electus]POP50582.1 DUF333 domain-containing protein [Superficieibacter electus]